MIGYKTMDFYQRQIDKSAIYQIDSFVHKKRLNSASYGFVLFVKEVDREKVRIYYAKDVVRSLKDWQALDPECFIVLWAMPALSGDLEKIQNKFSKYLYRADWYEYNKEIYEFIVNKKYGRSKVEHENKVQQVSSADSEKTLHEDREWFKNNLLGLHRRRRAQKNSRSPS